jgi:mRNA-degrading endonuclease RelE of RelBE toxin-antitoxin system
MSSSIRIKQSALEALRTLEAGERTQLLLRIQRLPETPGAGGVLKGELRGLRRLRIAGHRLVWEQREDHLLIVLVRPARYPAIDRPPEPGVM